MLDAGADAVTSAFKGRGWQEAILNLAGDRVALIVNGKLICDVRSTVEPASGGWSLLRLDAQAEFEFESASRL